MRTTRVHLPRLLLTLGLVAAFSISIPVGAGASDAAATASGRADEPLATTSLATGLDRQAWIREITRDAFARIRTAEAVMSLGPAPATTTASGSGPSAAPAPATTTASKTATASTATTSRSYAGTNHLWIPSLGISHSVAAFACTRSTPPGPGVYRWGCAGRNNAYLFGHAWSTFKPLHDAYVAKRLHTGMLAWYADGSGRVRTYKVTAIRVVTPDQTAWAIAAQPVASMTLQTCVGSRSQYRLLVRLVAIN
jgi:sortase (surface protein transpeptidase)